MNANEIVEFCSGIAMFALPASVLWSILQIRTINKETKEIENSY